MFNELIDKLASSIYFCLIRIFPFVKSLYGYFMDLLGLVARYRITDCFNWKTNDSVLEFKQIAAIFVLCVFDQFCVIGNLYNFPH